MSTEITHLNTLADEINELDSHFKENAMQFAYDCGIKLLAAKKLVAHGNFQEWVDANCSVGYRQAAKYMKVAKHWEELTNMQSTALLGIDEAMDMLNKSKGMPKAKPVKPTIAKTVEPTADEPIEAVFTVVQDESHVSITPANFSDEELLSELLSRGYKSRQPYQPEKIYEPILGYDGNGPINDPVAILYGYTPGCTAQVHPLMVEARGELCIYDFKPSANQKLAILHYHYSKLNPIA